MHDPIKDLVCWGLAGLAVGFTVSLAVGLADGTFGDDDAGEDADGADEAACSEDFVEYQDGGDAADRWFECQDETDALSADVLLRPGLQNEAERRADEAEDDERNELLCCD